jgi:hypothetical protein
VANINEVADQITHEALRILHQKLNFCSNIVTGYDDSYGVEGAKIGSDLRIRLPHQYNTGTGPTIDTGTAADSVGTHTTLQVTSQRHVPLRFTSVEDTLDIDDYSRRHIQPAMSKLAAKVEFDVLGQALKYCNESVLAATPATVIFRDAMECRRKLVDNLAPEDERTALMDTKGNLDLIDANKNLFHDSSNIEMQYKKGYMGEFGSFNFFENTLIPKHSNGTEAGTAYLTNDVTAQEKTLSVSDTNPNEGTLIVDTGTLAITAGSVFTIADVFDVHHETKATTGVLKQFVARSALTGAGTLSISPAIIASGPYQNVTAAAANNKALTFLGAASTTYNQSILFQKGFAAFATADLVLPRGTDMASRKVFDGLSLRLVRDFDVKTDKLITRIDILYGFKVLRPELCARLWHTG